MNLLSEIESLPRSSAVTLAIAIVRKHQVSAHELAQAMGRVPGQIRNLINGKDCPPVVCQRKGPYFRWHDGGRWVFGDALPADVVAQLPASEVERIERHVINRDAQS